MKDANLFYPPLGLSVFVTRKLKTKNALFSMSSPTNTANITL